MDSTFFTRQLDILPTDSFRPVTIIGCGGIGSITSLVLSKMGSVDLTLYDDDTVEDHNLPTQLFIESQVGESKVSALATNLSVLSLESQAKAKNMKWDGTMTPIVISAVDSMATRKEIWERMKTAYGVELYIEARMGAENMRLYAFQPANSDHHANYEATLYDDTDAIQEPCTAKAIAYNTFVIGGLIGSILKKHLKRERVPFETIFDLTNFGLYSS